MSHPRSRSALLTVLFLVASLIVGCGDDSGPTGGNGLEKTKIKVATLPMVNDAPLYVGIRDKLFEKEGLDVQAVPVQKSADAIPGMSNGGIDVVFGNHATFFALEASGSKKVRLINEATTLTPKHMAVLVAKDSPVKTMKDLEGRTIAVHLVNNIQQLTFNAVLKHNGIDTSKIKYTQVLFPNMGAALDKGDVDAVHIVEPYLTDAVRKLGARLVADGGGEPVTGMPLDGYYVADDWARKNPKTAAAFQRAMLKAQASAADRTKLEGVLPQFTKIDPGMAKAMTIPGYPTSTDTTRLERLNDLMSGQAAIKSKLDISSFVIPVAAP
jgi:NitT/TauT family transport system substrate-binding protein